MGNEEVFSPELLQLYYDRLFPYEQMVQWLSYDGDTDFFHRRELSFTLEDDTYIRFKSFHTAAEMRTSMIKMLPFKIDIGAVFSVSPAEKGKVNSSEFVPEQRELVFDIDLTDYDDVRTCCQGAAICSRCWKLMIPAVKVMEASLRQDFGFQQLMWVYSGRRGIHCWVSDEAARNLTDEARSAVTQYLSLVEASENTRRKVRLQQPLHPSLNRAYQIIEPLFVDLVIKEDGLGVLMEEKRWKPLLDMIPDDDLRRQLEQKWTVPTCTSSPEEKWEQLVDSVNNAISRGNNALGRKRGANQQQDASRRAALADLRTCVQEIVLAYLYPRLDANVSKQRNHLLKSPFAVHPKTGRVCVPLDADTVEDFNPFTVPTLGQLQEELNEASGDKAAWDKTSMGQSVKLFESTMLKQVVGAAKDKRRMEQESEAAFTGDW